jgi:cyclopropane-fatty-acyl-phospholipid synthase
MPKTTLSHYVANPPDPPETLASLLSKADITINGSAPWDVQVYDEKVYRDVLTKGSLGLGQAFIEGRWDCNRLDEFFCRAMRANLDEQLGGWAKLHLLRDILRHALFNLQSPQRAYQVAQQHYDIGNDVFEAMLDSSMSYSCAYWQHAQTLEQAQHDKLEMICRKLDLQANDRVLEIGCGWGGLAQHMAQNYGVQVLGITVSKEQQRLAQQRCAGLPINIQLMDYRQLTGHFDKIVSAGMFEHVGPKNFPIYFDTVHRLLDDNGLFLLHSIGNYKTAWQTDVWIDRHIFPNGKLPSASEIANAIEQKFLIEDWHNFGPDYDLTLMAWWERFNNAWPQLQSTYDESFYRMWKYYLMCCAGYFRSRQGQLWQLVLSKRASTRVYRSIRPTAKSLN